MGKFTVKKTNTGIKFDLKAANGEIIATSEVYKSKASCQNGIKSVQKNAVVAEIEDTTEKDFTAVKHPKFQVYLDKKGEYRFRLTASNGQIITVGEGYKTKAGCLNGIKSIKKNAPTATIVEPKA